MGYMDWVVNIPYLATSTLRHNSFCIICSRVKPQQRQIWWFEKNWALWQDWFQLWHRTCSSIADLILKNKELSIWYTLSTNIAFYQFFKNTYKTYIYQKWITPHDAACFTLLSSIPRIYMHNYTCIRAMRYSMSASNYALPFSPSEQTYTITASIGHSHHSTNHTNWPLTTDYHEMTPNAVQCRYCIYAVCILLRFVFGMIQVY